MVTPAGEGEASFSPFELLFFACGEGEGEMEFDRGQRFIVVNRAAEQMGTSIC